MKLIGSRKNCPTKYKKRYRMFENPCRKVKAIFMNNKIGKMLKLYEYYLWIINITHDIKNIILLLAYKKSVRI